MRTTALLPLFVSAAPLFAQISLHDDEDVEAKQRHAASAIRRWVDDYESARIGPRAPLRAGVRLQPRYMSDARQGGFLADREIDRITHLDMLQKLLFFAEENPSGELCDAMLDVAAAGLDGSLLDRDAREMRELAHWALMRVEDQGVWFRILRAAAGDRVPVLAGARPTARPDEAVSEGPARRVAALRLLGQRGLPVFRSTLEGALTDKDPRVRLAAAESIQQPWKAATMRRLAGALENERHPVVSQAMVRLLFTMLRRPPEDLEPAERQKVLDAALTQFGRCGWRTDMDLLDLVEEWPSKAAIPHLIEALDLSIREPDALVSAVNRRASPLLRERAGSLLKALTGALVPIDDVDAWRAFWAKEQHNIVVPNQLRKPDSGETRVAFFGVPVTGTSIAFLIDTSGSMEEAPAGDGPITGTRRERLPKTRLDAAKSQLALAAQVMEPGSQFFVMTFAEDARCWTQRAVKPGRNVSRSLTGLMSRLNAHGGTNLYAGLVEALEMEGRKFGGEELPKIDELFVLSDGEPTTGDVRDADTLLELVRHANKYAKVRINTVFTGSGKGSELLRRLAEENGGVFVQR